MVPNEAPLEAEVMQIAILRNQAGLEIESMQLLHDGSPPVLVIFTNGLAQYMGATEGILFYRLAS